MAINESVIKQLNLSEDQLTDFLVGDMGTIFENMAGIANVSQRPKIIDPINVFTNCVTALVGLGGACSGLVSLHLPDLLAREFTSGMLGTPITSINRDVHDAIGELALMIAGSFKHHFVTNGHEAQLSTPSVISGERYVMTIGSPADSLTLMFRSGDENFLVSVYVESAT